MIGENATVINIQFLHVFTKLTLPPSLIYGLERQTIRSFNRLSPKNVCSFMRVSTVVQIRKSPTLSLNAISPTAYGIQVQTIPVSAIAKLNKNKFSGFVSDLFQQITTKTKALQTIAHIVISAITAPIAMINEGIFTSSEITRHKDILSPEKSTRRLQFYIKITRIYLPALLRLIQQHDMAYFPLKASEN